MQIIGKVLFILSTLYLSTLGKHGIKKVKDMNVLIPQIYENLGDRKIKHDLEAYNGCYQWTSSDTRYFHLNQIPDETHQECHSICEIYLQSNQDLNNVIWITASDQVTNDRLRIETNIKPIVRIEILTKFRTIDFGDVQIFELIGFDEDDNSFSSLEGIRFDWSIQQEDEFLEFVPLKESQIQTTELRKNLESFHNPFFFTDQVAVIGKKTGKTLVTAKLNEQGYEKPISHTVEIHVIEQFIVFPYDNIRVLTGVSVPYQLFYKPKTTTSAFQNDTYTQIVLPSKNYNWCFIEKDLNISSVKFHKAHQGTIYQDQDGQKKEGQLVVGETTGKINPIFVKDMRSQENIKKAFFTVVQPHHINFQIKEFESEQLDFYSESPSTTSEKNVIFENSLHLVKGRKYYIRAELYDTENNLIYITPDTIIEYQFDSKYFDISQDVYRGQIVVVPKQLGKKLDIQVQLKSNAKIFKVKQTEIVLPIIMISPLEINLPLQNRIDQQQPYYMQYLGGSLEYTLESVDTKIVQVSEVTGSIIAGQQEGVTSIILKDSKNFKNFVQIKVDVSNVDSVQALEQQKEVKENEEDYIFPVALNGKGEKYHNCTVLNFNMEQNEYLEIPIKNRQDLTYNEVIKSLEYEAENFEYMAQLLAYDKANNAKFQEYIQDKQITSEQLLQKQNYLRNFGVCQKVRILGTQIGNQIVALTTPSQKKSAYVNNKFYRSFDVKVLKMFENVWQQYDLEQQLVKLGKTSQNNNNKLEQGNDRIVLSHGSTFQWNLQGGLDLWPKRDHQFAYTVQEDVNGQKKAVSDKLNFQENSLNTTFTCAMPNKFSSPQIYNNDFDLVLRAQNKADLKLPKPVKFSHQLQVSCSVPTTVHIYEFNTTSSKYSDEYREKISSEDMLYIKNNQLNFLKVKAFDKNSQLFFNYTSLKFIWKLSNDQFGELSNDSVQQQDANHIDIFQQFQSTNMVTKTNKDLILKVHTVGFKKYSQSFNEVWDQVGLRILNNVKLIPNHLRIYKYQDHSLKKSFAYNIRIEDGFGPFIIGEMGGQYDQDNENNNGVVISYVHDQYRNIQVTPERYGQALIHADDFKTLGSERAFCEIIVEDVLSLVISIQQTLIPEFNTTTVNVDALGEFGQEFFQESYQFMDLHLEAELVVGKAKTESEQLTFVRSEENPKLFSVQGKRRGLYKITAILTQNGLTHKKSNQIELEVFTKLHTYPPVIIMAPGCELGLQILGGPQDLSNLQLITTDLSKNEKSVEIIEIEEKRLFIIKAKQVFTQEISFALKQNDLLLTQVKVPLNIKQISRVRISGGNSSDRTLHLGTQIRLMAELYAEDQQMAMQVCDYKIEWESEAEQILKLYHQENIYPQNSEFQNFDHQQNFQLAINTSAIAVGKSNVSFRLFTKNNQVIKSAPKQFDIIAHLSHDAPTYIAQEDIFIEPVHTMILMPPNSRYILHPNKQKMDYELFNTNKESSNGKNEDRFILNAGGEIYAKTNKQRISATVKVHDQEQNEFMSINVQTANIIGIFVQNSHTVFRIPQEKEAKLRIHLQDSLGRSFPSGLVGVNVQVSVTNPRVLDGYISSDLKFLDIRSKSSGFTLVKVYLQENPNIFDIFRINVGSVITPESPISVIAGGLINFSLSDKSIGSSQSRHWKSLDKSILTIDSIKGSAIAQQPGEVIVEAGDGGPMAHQARVVVSRIVEFLHEAPLNNILTDMQKSRYYQDVYDLKFQAVYQEPNGGRKAVLKTLRNSKSSAEINNDLHFSCSIQNQNAAKWFVISTYINDNEGVQTPSCVVSLPPLSAHQDAKSVAPDSIQLVVSLKNSQNQVRFEQRFDYSIQWVVKSKEYNQQNNNNNQNRVNNNNNINNNNNSFNNNKINNNNDQQQQFENNNNNNNFNNYDNDEENDSESTFQPSWIDHLTIIVMIIISMYYYTIRSTNSFDFSIILYGIIVYIAYLQFVSWYFSK